MLVTLIVVSIIGISLVSAGLWSKITGRQTAVPTAVNVTGAGAPPQIVWVGTLNDTIPAPAPSTTTNGVKWVQFSFIANSSGGVGNLNDASSQGQIQRIGESTRFDIPCTASSPGAPYDPGFYVNYTCIFLIYHYDGPGGAQWILNATIADIASQKAENSTRYFNMGSTSASYLVPAYLNWSSVTIGQNNIIVDAPRPAIYNAGNVDTTGFNVNATNLTGIEHGVKLSAASFTCTITPICSNQFNRFVAEQWTTTGITRAKGTSGTPIPSQNANFCLKEVTVPSDSYNATRHWEGEVLYT